MDSQLRLAIYLLVLASVAALQLQRELVMDEI